MPESFGARLRRQREEQNVCLATIAEQTKIKMSLLEALERDDVSHWPSGIFRRAYIRSYAHAIGLSPDAVLREFLEVHPDPAEEFADIAVTVSGGDGVRDTGGPPTRFRYLVGSAIASLARLRRSPDAEGPMVPNEPTRGRNDVRDVFSDPSPEEVFDNVIRPVPLSEPLMFEPAPALEAAVSVEDADVGSISDAAMPEQSVPDTPAEPVIETSPLSETVSTLVESPGVEPTPALPDLTAVANLCTALGRVERAEQVQPLLGEVARLLNAPGLIVWTWDPFAAELRPALVQGYSERVVAQLPPVTRDADNATAAAFRTAETIVIAGTNHTNGALVIPLLAPGGCAGVLALELQHGDELTPGISAVALIFAALLAQLIGGGSPGDLHEQAAMTLASGDSTSPILRVNVRAGHPRVRPRSSTLDRVRASAADRRRPS